MCSKNFMSHLSGFKLKAEMNISEAGDFMDRTPAIDVFKTIMEAFCIDKHQMMLWGFAALNILEDGDTSYFTKMPPYFREECFSTNLYDMSFTLIKNTVKKFKLDHRRIKAVVKFAEQKHLAEHGLIM